MIPSDNIEKLERAIVARREEKLENPNGAIDVDNYILFLGAGCARAANIPSFEEIAHKVLAAYDSDTKIASELPSKADRSDSKKLLKAFYKLLERMSSVEIFAMLQSFFADIPVPTFYQELALLIKDRYFNRILTTNFDTLLEQALNGAGLHAGLDYHVKSLGNDSYDQSSVEQVSAPHPDRAIYIVKLHGDLAQQDVNITPEEIEEALRSRRRFVKDELEGDLIMVGYQFESQPINHWLTQSHRKELWWINAPPPPSPEHSIDHWASEIYHMDAKLAEPEVFFSQMALRLMRRPAYESLKKNSFRKYAATTRGVKRGRPIAAAASSPTDEDIQIEDLRAKIRTGQTVINSLEQMMMPGERPANIQAQIDYQKRQIAQLEDELRSLSTCASELRDLLEQTVKIVQSVYEVADDDQQCPKSTLLFLQELCDTIGKEYQASKPNQYVVSSAVDAVLNLIERLSIDLRAQTASSESDTARELGEMVRKIASFAPSIAARGIR